MTCVFNQTVDGPATHCLVIGAGAYQPNTWAIPDLTSPALSAGAMIDWLRDEYNNIDAPLGTIEAICSPSPGQAPPAGCTDAATITNVENAVSRWFNRCNSSPDNIAIFYFCGHGFQRGFSQVLLLEEFAAPAKLAVGNDAIDFGAFSLGMGRCAARKQIYFVDACRATPRAALQIPVQLGKAIIEPNYALVNLPTPRDWPVIYATAESSGAFGSSGSVSVFTQALLTCLRGAGWDDREDPWNKWCVNVDSLATFVRDLLEFESAVRGVPIQSPTRGGESTGFVLHHARAGRVPDVPLLVGRQQPSPDAAAFEIRLNGDVIQSNSFAIGDWPTSLPAGPKYLVSGTSGPRSDQVEVVVRPACKTARLGI